MDVPLMIMLTAIDVVLVIIVYFLENILRVLRGSSQETPAESTRNPIREEPADPDRDRGATDTPLGHSGYAMDN